MRSMSAHPGAVRTSQTQDIPQLGIGRRKRQFTVHTAIPGQGPLQDTADRRARPSTCAKTSTPRPCSEPSYRPALRLPPLLAKAASNPASSANGSVCPSGTELTESLTRKLPYPAPADTDGHAQKSG